MHWRAITVLPQENEHYRCQISPSLSDQSRTSQVFYEQTKEHAIAVALEHLADEFYSAAEASQDETLEDPPDNPVVALECPQEKCYHVILQYERIAKAESKFEAMHDTILRNTVVENAKCTMIEIAADADQPILCKEWQF